MLQLNPPIHVTTPKGEGFALVLLDYGPCMNTVWIVHLFASGKVIHVESCEVRVMGNDMYGIPTPEQPKR